MRPSDHGLHRIIGSPRDGDELIAGTQDAEQHRCECMRPRYELHPHECPLRTKDAGVELVELFASEIAVRIARTHAEMRIGDTARTHGIQYLSRIKLRDLVHMRKHAPRALDDLCAQRA